MTDTRTVVIRCDPFDLLAEEARERDAAERAGEELVLTRYEREDGQVKVTLIFRERSGR